MTFLQITHHLELNLRFVFEFGKLHRYETLLHYHEFSARSRPYLETKILTFREF